VRESECLLLQVKEIELEEYTEPETAQKKDTKQTAAVDLSKRLKDFRSLNDASSLKGFSLYTLLTFLNHNFFYVQIQTTTTEKWAFSLLFCCQKIIYSGSFR
jgi:hypothetical protein